MMKFSLMKLWKIGSDLKTMAETSRLLNQGAPMKWFVVMALAIMSGMLPFLFADDQNAAPQVPAELTWGKGPFAVVELFTSQGCSSCPAADRNLSAIVERAKASDETIYALSFHVDYWNKLGWKDPYSSEKMTQRQQAYAGVLGSGLYTPQMIVNGTVEFVGSNTRQAQTALKAALAEKPKSRLGIAVAIQENRVQVRWQAEQTQDRDLIFFCLTQKAGEQDVTRGENAGSRLSHSNVVRALASSNASSEKQLVTLELPEDADRKSLEVIAFVQENDTADIKAVVSVPVAE